MKTGETEKIVWEDMLRPNSIAVDWNAQNIYWVRNFDTNYQLDWFIMVYCQHLYPFLHSIYVQMIVKSTLTIVCAVETVWKSCQVNPISIFSTPGGFQS